MLTDEAQAILRNRLAKVKLRPGWANARDAEADHHSARTKSLIGVLQFANGAVPYRVAEVAFPVQRDSLGLGATTPGLRAHGLSGCVDVSSRNSLPMALSRGRTDLDRNVQRGRWYRGTRTARAEARRGSARAVKICCGSTYDPSKPDRSVGRS